MNLELLLTKIADVTKKHEEIYRSSGEQFNVFDLLGLSNDEISHSKIIASLLDAEGTHGKGTKFIKLFCDCVLCPAGINDFLLDNVVTETEKSIGYISDDYNAGGRMDIVLTNAKNQQIFIENKIYAADQNKQLSRYHRYNPKAYLLYLTLDGKDPSEESIGDMNPEIIKKISYKKHILEWLELCKIESIDNPLLRETLTQYIVLIKQLTGQARSEKMKNEYLDILTKDADNVSAAFIISQNVYEIRLKILNDKFTPLISGIAKKFGFCEQIDGLPFENDCFSSCFGFSLKKPAWNNIQIAFEFSASNLRNLSYGVFVENNISNKLDRYLRDLCIRQNSQPTELWPFYQKMDYYKDWDDKFYLDLYSNSAAIRNVFESKITELLSIIENKGYEL